MVIIGVDPHPDSHTAAALDTNGKILATLTVANTAAGLAELRGWAKGFRQRQWAVEGASNPFGTALSHPLAEREAVVDISPSLTSQYRSKRGRKKSDEVDAVNIARAALANPELSLFNPIGEQEQLKELVRTRERLSQQLRAHRLALRQTSEGGTAREVLGTLITCLKTQLEVIDKQLRQLEGHAETHGAARHRRGACRHHPGGGGRRAAVPLERCFRGLLRLRAGRTEQWP